MRILPLLGENACEMVSHFVLGLMFLETVLSKILTQRWTQTSQRTLYLISRLGMSGKIEIAEGNLVCGQVLGLCKVQSHVALPLITLIKCQPPGFRMLCPPLGFLNLSTTVGLWVEKFFVVSSCHVHCRMLSRILVLSPQGNSSTHSTAPVVTTQNSTGLPNVFWGTHHP